MDIYLDANAIINCMKLGCWGSVLALPSHRCFVVENVVQEVRYPAEARLLRCTFTTGRLHRVQVVEIDELKAYVELKTRLGDGEAAALALAALRSGLVASDEKGRFLREAERLLGQDRVLRTADLAVAAIHGGTTTLAGLRSKASLRMRVATHRGKLLEAEHLGRLVSEVEARLREPVRRQL